MHLGRLPRNISALEKTLKNIPAQFLPSCSNAAWWCTTVCSMQHGGAKWCSIVCSMVQHGGALWCSTSPVFRLHLSRSSILEPRLPAEAEALQIQNFLLIFFFFVCVCVGGGHSFPVMIYKKLSLLYRCTARLCIFPFLYYFFLIVIRESKAKTRYWVIKVFQSQLKSSDVKLKISINCAFDCSV